MDLQLSVFYAGSGRGGVLGDSPWPRGNKSKCWLSKAWDRVHPYLSYGFGPAGQSLVASVGYVAVNAALLAKMKIRNLSQLEHSG